MQKKTFFAYAIAIAGIVILSGAAVTPVLSREAQNAMNATAYQLQSADSSYAYVPQQVDTGPRYGQCWIHSTPPAPAPIRGASHPSLDPKNNPEW